MNILKTFEIFLREPLSILRQGLIQIVGVQTNIFAQKPSISVDMLEQKAQITVYNSDKMYNLFQTVLYKTRMRANEPRLEAHTQVGGVTPFKARER